MQKDDSITSARAKADSTTKDENIFVSSHDTKPNVVGSQCHGTSIERVTKEKQSAWIVKFFRYGYRNGREMNIRIGKFCLRIARHQLALWKNSNPVFNLLY